MKWTGKFSLALATVATLFGAAGTPTAKAQQKKPNIVIIWAMTSGSLTSAPTTWA
jgi:hypothetical protein